MVTTVGVERWHFNPDEDWHLVCARYESVITAMAIKVSMADEALREDAAQEARIALLCVHPERIKGYSVLKHGPVTPDNVPLFVDRYMRNTARNAMYSYMQSRSKGNLYIGRTWTKRDKTTGEKRRVYYPARFTPLEELLPLGFQIDQSRRVSWDETGLDDGLRSYDDV